MLDVVCQGMREAFDLHGAAGAYSLGSQDADSVARKERLWRVAVAAALLHPRRVHGFLRVGNRHGARRRRRPMRSARHATVNTASNVR